MALLRTLRWITAALMAGAVLPATAQTAGYPNRVIRFIVPTPPGGGGDGMARLVAKKLSDNVRQPVVVDNRPGAAGNTAAALVTRMPADGYTVFVGAIATLAINPSLYKSLPYEPLRDFAPVTNGVTLTNLLVVHPSLPVSNVKELLALARARPGSINYASSGNGTSGHLAGALFAKMGNVTMTHVPYKGGGQAMNDLLAGQVQISFASPASALPFVRAGTLKALGVTTESRLASLPDLPTIAEAGLPGFSANNWYCFVVPAGTPSQIIDKLNLELRKVLSDPEIGAALTAQGMEPAPGTPQELGAFIRSELDKWGKIIKAGNFTAD